MEELAALIEANTEAAAAIAASYQALLGGVPNIAGFEYVINAAEAAGINDFNQENIFINMVNSLVQGNPTAAANFEALIAGQSTLANQVEALYKAFVPVSEQSQAGIDFLTRPEALQFYQDAVVERGIEGPHAAAIAALAEVLNVLYSEDIGLGNSVNDLLAAIADGSALLPADGNEFTPIEIADGTNYDGDDAADDAGINITLTDRIDAPGIDESQPGSGRDTTGTDGNDTYIANVATLNPGDMIDGKGGYDTLQLNLDGSELTGINVVGDHLIFQLPAYQVNSTGLESVVTQLSGTPEIIAELVSGGDIGGARVDLLRAKGVESLGVDQTSGVISYTSIQNNVDIDIARSNGVFSYSFDVGALKGETDLNVSVSDTLALLMVETNGGDAFKSLTLDTSGSNVLIISDNGDSSLPLTTLTVTGDGTNILVSDVLAGLLINPDEMNEFSSLTTIDFSGNTGGTAIELLNNVEDVTFTGGSGSDIVLFGSDAGGGFVTNGDSLDGGAGYDVLGFGGDDLAALSPATVENFELFALLNDASGADYEYEGSDFSAEVALFADWNATFRVDDYDGRSIYVLGDLANTTLQWDDTDVASITLGLPAELQAYVDLINNAADSVGLDVVFPGLPITELPITSTIGEVDTRSLDAPVELELNVAPEGGLLASAATSLIIEDLRISATQSALELITVAGMGDVEIQNVIGSGNLAGMTFDLTGSSGLVDLDGIAGGKFQGSQIYQIGSGDLETLAGAGNTDNAQDLFVFNSDFGLVTITGFGAWANESDQGEQDLLDFTALGVSHMSELSFALVGADTHITSSAFEGEVILVGVTIADLAIENFAGLTA